MRPSDCHAAVCCPRIPFLVWPSEQFEFETPGLDLCFPYLRSFCHVTCIARRWPLHHYSLRTEAYILSSRLKNWPLLPWPVLPIWLFWGQICNFSFFSPPLACVYFWKKAKWDLAFFGLFWLIRFFMSIWQILRWFWEISWLYFWTQNKKCSLETLHKN